MVGTAYKRAVQRLWTGQAKVTVLEGVLDPATGRTEPKERVAMEEVPCRVSYRSVSPAAPEEEAAQAGQGVTLYIDPAVDIPEGSKVTVTQNGVTRDYARSGKTAVYSCHQEVPLEVFRGWA